MQRNTCPHCEQAQSALVRGARHLYPIWNVHCDACCRRVLAFYPENHMSSMNMALIVGMKRGFQFVTAVQTDLRDARLAALAAADDPDGWSDPYVCQDETTSSRGRSAAVGAGGWPADGFMRSYLEFRGQDAVRRFKQSSAGRRVAR